MLVTLRGQEGGEDLSVGEGGEGEAQICGAGLLRACSRSIVARVQLLPELIIRANPGCQFVLSVNKESKFLKNCGAPSVGEYNRII